jgi:hypothetical protein
MRAVRGVGPLGQMRERGPGTNRTADLERKMSHNNPQKIAFKSFESEPFKRMPWQRMVELWHLGARVLFEFVDELDCHHCLGDDLDRRVERYVGLDLGILRALGRDCSPPLPIHVVSEEGR